MEPTEPRSSTIGPSLDQNTLDSLQFNEEIQHSLTVLTENANSFTSLLDLPAPQAVELLPHYPESNDPAPSLTVTADAHHTLYHFNPGANLTFPSNLALIEPPAMFSVFAGEHHQNYHNNNNDDDHDINSYININNTNNYSPETTGTVPSNSSGNLGKEKNKPAELDSNNNNDNPNSSRPLDISSEKHNQNQRSAKRKEREKRAKAATKKSKSGVNDSSEDAEVLPFVHVRARRGEATDSHSLAERVIISIINP